MKRLTISLVTLLLFAVAASAQTGASIDGAITASSSSCVSGACVQLALPSGASAATIQITGSPTATIQFEASPDGGTYTSITGYPLPSGSGAYYATGNGLWQFSVGGLKYLRARASAYTSGSASIIVTATDGAYVAPAALTATIGTVDQGTAAAGSAAWPVVVTEDSTNTKVKAGDATNKAVRVNVVAGAASGTQYNAGDVKGSSTGTLAMVSDGTLMRAAAGTTAGLVKVDLSGTDTNTTPVQVQSNSANIATQTTAASIKTDVDTLVTSGGGGYVRQDSTATIAKETGGNLATIATDIAPLVTSGGGGYVRQDSTATIAKETGGNLASVKTDVDTLVTAGGGGYVRQDSTATIAKETGGNLATVKTNTDPLVTAGGGGYVRQDSTATIAKETGGNLATLAGAVASSRMKVTGSGTAGSAASDVYSVQGVASMTPVVVAPVDSGGTSMTNTTAHAEKVTHLDSGGTDITDTSNHALKVSVVSGGGTGGTASNFAAAFPAAGTAIGAKNGSNMVNLTADGSGYLNVNVAAGSAGNGAASATGSSVPAQGDYTGINVAGNLRGQTGVNPTGSVYASQTDLSSIAGTVASVNTGTVDAGTQRVVLATDQATNTNSFKIKGAGTAGSADTGVVTVQGIASGTTIPVTPAANSTVDLSRVAGTTTSTSNGTVDAGTQRVAIASNNTPFPVKTDQTTHGTTDKTAADLYQGGSAVAVGNGVYVQPGTAASFTVAQSTATNLKTQAEAYQGGSAVAAANGLYVRPGTSAVFQVQSNSADLATAAKQPALGTAGSASSDVITVQGVSSMTPLLVSPGTADAAEGATLTNPPVPIAGLDASSHASIPRLDASHYLYTNNAVGKAFDGSGTANDGTHPIYVAPLTSGWTVTAAQSTPASLKAQVYAVDSTGADATDSTNHAVKVNVVAGSAANAAASATGSAVPASADYAGLNVAGTLRGRSGVALTGPLYAAMSDISAIGGTAVGATNGLPVYPQTSSVWGLNDGAGNLVAAAHPLPSALYLGTVAASTGAGANGTGVTRVTLATDQTAISTAGVFSVKTDQTTHGTTDKTAADVYVGGAVNSLTNGVFVTPTTANSPFAVSSSTLAADSTLAKLTIASGTAAGSNTFALGGASATTNAPTTTTGNLYPLSMDVKGGLRILPMDSGGTSMTEATNHTMLVSGGIASGATDSGNPVKVGGKYNATPPTLTDGQRGDLQLNSNGQLIVAVNGLPVDAAEGAAAGTTPSLVGGRATSTENASVDTGDAVRIATDLKGRQIVTLNSVFELKTSGNATVNATTEQDIIAADASYKICITDITVYNADATNSEVIQVLDNGAIGTGTLMFYAAAPANGGEAHLMTSPRCTSAVNHKITVDSTGSANPVYISVGGFKTAE